MPGLLGDANEVVVIDAAHDDAKIATAIGARRFVAVVCTHAHNDHINAAPPWPIGPEHPSCFIWTTGSCGSRRTLTEPRTAT